MAKSDSGDKTEAPTPKKKKDARKEGQIAKTAELGMWLQVIVASFGLQLIAAQAHDGLTDVAADVRAIAAEPSPTLAIDIFGKGLGLVLRVVLPFGLVMMLVGVISLVCQTGLVLATKAAKPKWSKVNPVEGIKRLFKAQGLWEGAKAVIKLTVLTIAAWKPVLNITQDVLDSGNTSMIAVAGEVAAASMSLARTVAFTGIVLAIADYGVQKWQTTKQLKMSKKEIRDEHKSAEGDPQLKGQIRRKQQDMSRNRMLAGVADASAVIVNPTHIAVAIKYEAGSGAPKVVAKGKGLIADRIREEAAKHYVPIVRDIPLARTLEKSCKVDQTIPPDLYEAVARLLAFVMQVGKRASLLGGVLENPAATRVPIPT